MLIVARDIAHAKLLERLEAEGELPQYMRDHAMYCDSPAKTPEGTGHASGSFGQTAAGRMDSYVDAFQAAGGSMLANERSKRRWRFDG